MSLGSFFEGVRGRGERLVSPFVTRGVDVTDVALPSGWF